MTSYDNRNTETPTAGSVAGMWAITAIIGVATLSIFATGSDFDWGHVTGFVLGFLATGLAALQSADRMWRRDAALWAAEQQGDAVRAVQEHQGQVWPEVGTWRAPDGAEAYIAWSDERRCYAVGGTLPVGTEPGFVHREEAHSAGLAMERAGYHPGDDDQTRSIRTRLMLPGWYAGTGGRAVADENKPWVMPTWMEPYREMIRNTGGNSIEELMNDTGTNAQNNMIRAALIVAVSSQVSLLAHLYRAGHLAYVRPDPER